MTLRGVIIQDRASVTKDPSVAVTPFLFVNSRMLPQDDNVYFGLNEVSSVLEVPWGGKDFAREFSKWLTPLPSQWSSSTTIPPFAVL